VTETHPTISGSTDLEKLVNRSRLLGADKTLVVHGGGNTSSKTRERDHLGRERDVLRVKGSGTDLKTIGADGFPGLYLDELLPLRELDAMSDEDMVAYLAHCMVEPGSRNPSIETLLHAFLPARHVDHTHADAICVLTNTPEGQRHVRAALGDDVAIVPYSRPGFGLSRDVAQLADASAVVLAWHGLVTWGDTHEASYQQTIDLVQRAETYLAQFPAPAPVVREDLSEDAVAALLLELRGLLSRDGRRVLHVDRSQRAIADRNDVDAVTARRGTPDHMLRIGTKSLALHDLSRVAEEVAAFEEDYRGYVARHQHLLPPGIKAMSSLPRIVLVPGLGVIATGPDAKTAKVNAEISARSHTVTARALDTFGATDWLSEDEVFAFDYWPLELRKLQSAPLPRPLSGQVVLLAGADGDHAEQVAQRLAADGAHLVMIGNDAARLEQLKEALTPGVSVVAGSDPVSDAIEAFGGVNVLVALEPVESSTLASFTASTRRQGLDSVLVGVRSGDATTLPEPGSAEGIRRNDVAIAAGSDPSLVAEAIAFLASNRSGATSGAAIPVG
jgi:rhamnose utilization protein RhaD (predicted bifunctional aldolase and dehydrogenase)/NAD(P)-dependent dehydrogenase (short-subunit alcohol dehydrogenase family)